MAYDSSYVITIISIREECTLVELRKDIHDEAPNMLPEDFHFVHNGKRVLKIRELQMQCKELQGWIQAKA